MLSIERTKKLLNDPTLSDKEVEEIRDDMHALAEIIFEDWMEKRREKGNAPKKNYDNKSQKRIV